MRPRHRLPAGGGATHDLHASALGVPGEGAGGDGRQGESQADRQADGDTPRAGEHPQRGVTDLGRLAKAGMGETFHARTVSPAGQRALRPGQ